MLGGVVFDALNLDFSFIGRRHDAFHQVPRRGAEGNFGDAQKTFFLGGNARPHSQSTTPQAVAILAGIHDAPGREIGHKSEGFVAENRNAGIDELDEIVRQDLACKTHSNSLHALGQQQRKFDR